MLIKLYGLTIKKYVRDEYNLFDGTLVIISLVFITLESFIGDTGASVITAFRSLRMLKVIKLASKSEGL